MDTIVRGKPIPKVFIRQKINVSTKTSSREVVDGQQRIRTILSYLKDGFEISKSQNAESGGKRFSQLPEETQAAILSYEVSVDLLINLPDAEILDIFGRLNSYAVVLNDQEKINASHFGPFKVVADKIAFKYNEYWTRQKILTPQQILRMQEVSLVADLLVALQDGIQPKKQIKRFYTVYEKSYEFDPATVESMFDRIIETIASISPKVLLRVSFAEYMFSIRYLRQLATACTGFPELTSSEYRSVALR